MTTYSPNRVCTSTAAIVIAVIIAVISMVGCFACGYQLAIDKVTTAECRFMEDEFFLIVDGNIYAWVRE